MGGLAAAPIDPACDLVDLLARGIECLQESCFRIAHFRAEMFEGIRVYKEENLHRAVIAPKTNATVDRVKTSAWIRKAQFHRWVPDAKYGSISAARVIV